MHCKELKVNEDRIGTVHIYVITREVMEMFLTLREIHSKYCLSGPKDRTEVIEYFNSIEVARC